MRVIGADGPDSDAVVNGSRSGLTFTNAIAFHPVSNNTTLGTWSGITETFYGSNALSQGDDYNLANANGVSSSNIDYVPDDWIWLPAWINDYVPAALSCTNVLDPATGISASDLFGVVKENVRRGHILPFPQEFWEQHPQEIIVVGACVFQFDNAEAPRALLAHPDFTRSGEATEDGGNPYQLRPCSPTVHGGVGFQRLGNDGETSYWWDWAAGAFFNEVRVVGYDLPVEKAQALARSLGHGTARGQGP